MYQHGDGIPFTVTIADHDPGADLNRYEEIAEIDFLSATGEVSLIGWCMGEWRVTGLHHSYPKETKPVVAPLQPTTVPEAYTRWCGYAGLELGGYFVAIPVAWVSVLV